MRVHTPWDRYGLAGRPQPPRHDEDDTARRAGSGQTSNEVHRPVSQRLRNLVMLFRLFVEMPRPPTFHRELLWISAGSQSKVFPFFLSFFLSHTIGWAFLNCPFLICYLLRRQARPRYSFFSIPNIPLLPVQGHLYLPARQSSLPVSTALFTILSILSYIDLPIGLSTCVSPSSSWWPFFYPKNQI